MSFFICGTDTDAGKTLASALLLRELHKAGKVFYYWKPIQTGEADDDSATAQRLSEIPPTYFLPKHCHLKEPLSPHRAAELEGRKISLSALLKDFRRHEKAHNLIIEGAGGLLVPLNRHETWLDFLQESRLPVVVVARSGLGTINHSLLTLRCLQAAQISVLGILFFGKENPDNLKTVCDFAKTPCLGAFGFTNDAATDGNDSSKRHDTPRKDAPENPKKAFELWHKLDLQVFG